MYIRVNDNSAIMFTMENFGDWLIEQLRIRNISQAELARVSGVSKGTVSNLINGTKGAGQDSLTAIARALRLPPEEVFRRAGILPPLPNKDLQDAEILERTSQMTPAQKRAVLAFINSLEAGDIQPAGESTNAVMGKTLPAKK